MAFCSKGQTEIKAFLEKLTPTVKTLVDDVTIVTGQLKELKSNPTVQEIETFIPETSPLYKYFYSALDIIVGTSTIVNSFAEKMQVWLSSTETQRNANLFKLASVAVAVGHKASGETTEKESFYDLAVQAHVVGIQTNK